MKLVACYLLDARRFMRAAYLDTQQTRNQKAAKANLLRLSHSLEKGMALPQPRKGFGSKLAVLILRDLNAYCLAFGPDVISNDCLKIIEATATYHLTRGADPDWSDLKKESSDIRGKYDFTLVKESQDVGAVEISKQQMIDSGPVDPEAFLRLRKSVRQFSDRPISKSEHP